MIMSKGEIHLKISIRYSKTKPVICNKGNLILDFWTSNKNETSILTRIVTNYIEPHYSTCESVAIDPRDLVKMQSMGSISRNAGETYFYSI